MRGRDKKLTSGSVSATVSVSETHKCCCSDHMETPI